MKTNALSRFRWGGAVVLAVFIPLAFSGCSTPASRIAENQELFAGFPPDVQENLRQGRFDIGYSRDMVYIALGRPNREYVRTTDQGTTEIWSFTEKYTTTSRQRVDGRFRVRCRDGSYQTVNENVWVDVPSEQEYEKQRIEFRDGRVVAIENVRR